MAQKKYRIEILSAARDEIREIAKVHLARVGPASARKITIRIKESLAHLCTHPRMGIAVEDSALGQRGYRRLVCGNYLFFYRLIGDTIFVYHIADGRTEYKQLFRGMTIQETETNRR